MENFKIRKIKAREILDSRGEPAVEVELITDFGSFFSSCPAGKSKGKYEAQEIRDGGKRYFGRGVLKAVRNVNKIIGPKLKGKNPAKQRELDNLLIKLDGTKNKSRLGVNAILPVSMVICRAGAKAKNIPLSQYIAQLFSQNTSNAFLTTVKNALLCPTPCFNVINGGIHAGSNLAIQEFMIIPQFKTFQENLRSAVETYQNLKKILIKNFGPQSINIGDEGGFTPPLFFTKEAVDLLMKAIKMSGYQNKIKIGLDCAASQFFDGKNYHLDKKVFKREKLINFYQNLVKKYPILFIEDPFSEDDFFGFQEIQKKLGKEVLIFGDDLLATNPGRMKMAKEKNLCNGAILKLNQIGTVTETLEAARLAKSFSWRIMVSHRSGETNDDFISDLAVGISADFIKAGAPARGERVLKYNRLLKIEENLS